MLNHSSGRFRFAPTFLSAHLYTLARGACALVLSLVLIGLIGGPGAAATRDITSPVALKAALADSAPGDVLRLAPGTYGALSLGRPYGTKVAPLTLRSADPANPARFTRVNANGAEGVVLDGLVFDYTFTPGDDFSKLRVSQINKSRDITIRNSLFAGDQASATGTLNDGYGAGQGLILRWVRDVTVEDSEFHTWFRGLVVSQSHNVTISGNDFHDMSSDGSNFAEVTDVLIENNHFHDFDRDPKSGAHPDMIQFWTNGTKTPSRNITIRDNILNSGHGLWTQSIFMRNELVDSRGAGHEMFYRNITITGNVIINSHLHGITVGETDGLTIANNTLVRNPRTVGDKSKGLAVWTPSIRVASRSRAVLVARNIAPSLTVPEKAMAWAVTNNLMIQETRPDVPNYYDAVFVAARRGDPTNLASFTYLPGSAPAQGIVGAPRLRTAALGATGRVPLIRVTDDPRYVNRFTFDAGLSQGADGQNTVWTFDDGTEATGQTVTHTFPSPGAFTVSLALGKGVDAPATSVRVNVPAPEVLRFDPATGALLIRSEAGLQPLKDSPAHRLTNGTHVLSTGQGQDPAQLGKTAIAGFFNASDFALDLRVRAAPTGTPAGEILRIHNNLILSMTPLGGITFWLNTAETPKPVTIATAPLRLHDGAWHDIGLRYDATTGMMSILVDGIERSHKQVRGKLRQMESWGLSFGNPFGKKSFDGEIAALSLQSNIVSFARP